MLAVHIKIQAIFFNSLRSIFRFEPITKLNNTVSQRNNFVKEKSILADQNTLKSPSKKIAKEEVEMGLKFKLLIESFLFR